MNAFKQRMQTADSLAEKKDLQIDYVNRYYDLIQQEKLSNKKKVEDAIKRQNFDIDQIQAVNAQPTESLTIKPNKMNQLQRVPHLTEQQTLRNMTRGNNFITKTSQHLHEPNDTRNYLTTLTDHNHTKSIQKLNEELDWNNINQLTRTRIPSQSCCMNEPSNYNVHMIQEQPRTGLCHCSFFNQYNSQIPTRDFTSTNKEGGRLIPYNEYRDINGCNCWQEKQITKCDTQRGINQQVIPHYRPNEHFYPYEMLLSRNNNCCIPHTPSTTNHVRCIQDLAHQTFTDGHFYVSQTPFTKHTANSMKTEWENNFNAARIERGNNILKNR